jgi:hypothetical protein
VSKIYLVCYKLRQQISKGLQRRSEAIRSAIEQYNTEAKKLSPPATELSWKQIASYSFLVEFDILRLRSHVQHEAWAKPAHHEAMVKYFKTCHAHEELIRLHVEVQRLRVSIQNETTQMQETLDNLLTTNPSLCAEIHRRWKLHSSVNDLHLERLVEIEGKPHFNKLEHRFGAGIVDDVFDDAADADDAVHVITQFMARITE